MWEKEDKFSLLLSGCVENILSYFPSYEEALWVRLDTAQNLKCNEITHKFSKMSKNVLGNQEFKKSVWTVASVQTGATCTIVMVGGSGQLT